MERGHPGKLELLRWVSGRLDGLREQRVLAHTRSCPDCRRRLVALVHVHRVLDVGGHVWSRNRRLLVAAALVATVAAAVVMRDAWWPVDGLGLLRPPPAVSTDPVDRLIASAGPDRMSPREAEELILNATAVRRLLGIMRPTASGLEARASDELAAALDALMAGDAAAAAAGFQTPPMTGRAALVYGLSLYAAAAPNEQVEFYIQAGLDQGDNTSLVSVGHWILGQLRLHRGDRAGARLHWQMAVDTGPGAFATLARAALEEIGPES